MKRICEVDKVYKVNEVNEVYKIGKVGKVIIFIRLYCYHFKKLTSN